MAIERFYPTLLLWACEGKVASCSLKTSGSLLLRTCHLQGFTSRKESSDLGGGATGGDLDGQMSPVTPCTLTGPK